MPRAPKVFLGGTVNGSTWRNRMTVYLHDEGFACFNPVVDDWDGQAQAREEREKASSDFRLYTITPMMTGVYSIAEVVDDSNKMPKKTVLVLLKRDGEKQFSDSQWKSLVAVSRIVKGNGGMVFDNLKECAVALDRIVRRNKRG